MKKMFAAILMIGIIILASTSWMAAQAEMRVTGFSYMGPVDEEGNCRPEKWFVYYKLDHGDEEVAVEVTQQDYNRIVAAYENEKKLDKADRDNLWYVKATNWVCNAGKDVADFVVFWD